MNRDDEFLCHRFVELANKCYQRNIMVHTDFLDLYSQSLFYTVTNQLPPVHFMLMGGTSISERKMVVFLPDEDYPFEIPYSVVKLHPAAGKFSEELSHRDFLGALMNLGLEREKMGDLVVQDGDAYLIAFPIMVQQIIDNLSTVRHTPVVATVLSADDFHYEPKKELIQNTVASVRLDSIISLAFSGSRSQLTSYITEGKVYVNGRLITTNAYHLHEGDLITVRGLGKLEYQGIDKETRKGRNLVSVYKFV